MKAKEARELKVGDWVTACYGNVYKPGQIESIKWPEFTLRVKFADGTFDTRTRNYRSLYRRVRSGHGEHLPQRLPAWLSWDKPQ